MDLTIKLKYQTSNTWVKSVLNDFDSFLQDHADCERKASAMAMSFVAKCPDRKEIIEELIETALEELVHFKLVYEQMSKRGIGLKKEIPEDIYIKQLIQLCRSGKDDRLLDRMIVAAVVETRGAERFRLVAENIVDNELMKFYTMLYKSEAKHGEIFLRLALEYWNVQDIKNRLDFFINKEAEICAALPFKPALH